MNLVHAKLKLGYSPRDGKILFWTSLKKFAGYNIKASRQGHSHSWKAHRIHTFFMNLWRKSAKIALGQRSRYCEKMNVLYSNKLENNSFKNRLDFYRANTFRWRQLNRRNSLVFRDLLRKINDGSQIKPCGLCGSCAFLFAFTVVKSFVTVEK